MCEWISVKDRMPDVGVPVLLWNVDGFAYVDTWSKFGCWTITPTTGEVTHWMPLPEPPESEDDAE